ncbi:EamA family transporter [Bacillaceae bacterium W0354]
MNKHVLLVLLAAILWGTTGTAQALSPTESTPLVVGALRLLVGGGALFIFILFKKGISLSTLPKFALFYGALTMALYQPFFFSGVKMTGVAIGTVVTICSAPIFAGLIEWMVNKKVPDRVWSISTLLAIVGCLFLFQSNTEMTFNPIGMAFSLVAGLVFAVYTFVTKSLVRNHSSDVVVAIVFSGAALMLLPILFFADLTWVLEVSGALSVLHLGLIATAIAYILFARGLKGVTASTAVTLALAEPLTASMLGIFLLQELITSYTIIGLVLLMCGLLLLSKKDKLLKQ